ncbi:TPA: hypothetical protein ACR3S6_004879 [Bacillus thuringiensis]
MDRPSSSVLYFPSIEFSSDEWIKSSLLIWDKIYRIVPKNYKPIDSLVVKEAQESGLIENIILEEEDVTQTGNEFLKFCDSIPFTPAGLEAGDYEFVHIDKIDTRLYPFLEKIVHHFNHEGFLRLSKELARGYMFYLSNTVATRRNLVRATDNRDSWTIAPYFTENANFQDYVFDRSAEGFYSSLIVKDLLPANLSAIDIKDIISFSSKRIDQKEEFRHVLNEFSQDINKIESKEFAISKIEEFKTRLETSKKELRKSMDFAGNINLHSLFVTGIPVSLTAYGGFIGAGADPFGLYTLFGSFMLGAVASYQNYNTVKSQDRSNQHISYLIDLDKELATKKVYPRFSSMFEEFIND